MEDRGFFEDRDFIEVRGFILVIDIIKDGFFLSFSFRCKYNMFDMWKWIRYFYVLFLVYNVFCEML